MKGFCSFVEEKKMNSWEEEERERNAVAGAGAGIIR